MKRFLIGLAIMFLTGMAVSAGATSLLINGDFENSTDHLFGWTIGSGDVEAVNITSGPFGTAEGMSDNYALLGVSNTVIGNNLLYQTIDVRGIDDLAISFDWAFDYYDPSVIGAEIFLTFVRQDLPPGDPINVLILRTKDNSQEQSPFGHYSGITNISQYTQETARIVFRLRADAERITSYAAIDNVKVEAAPAPEPSTMALAGTGLIGLAAIRRRKMKK